MTALAVATVLQVALLATGSVPYTQAYEAAVAADQPLLILVSAEWCPACQTMKQTTLPNVRRDGGLDDVAVTIVNPDHQPTLARKLMRGGSIPQLILFAPAENGWRRWQLIGAQSEGQIRQLLRTARGVRRQ